MTDLGLFQARYGYLATWDAAQLLGELAGHAVDPVALRAEFRDHMNA